MTLKVGDGLLAEQQNLPLKIKSLLGDGGQGVVYLVDSAKGPFAVKWYSPEQATPQQAASIKSLVKSGPPSGVDGKRFIWPLDMAVSEGSAQFGYVMPLIATSRFADLPQVFARVRPSPSYPTLCDISYQAASSYRALHLSGLCYRDVSEGNLMFDPESGDVLICDNDNVGVDGKDSCQVLGTLEFMAPEVVRNEVKPSTKTDLHSLAVLLFKLWVRHHPLHGNMEYSYRSWEEKARRKVYGQEPVFIFDPVDTRNRLPNDPDYVTPVKLWGRMPPSLKDLFTKAFTVGLANPTQRVTEGEWQSHFLQLKDGTLECPDCKAKSLWEDAMKSVTCWHCGKGIAIPPRLAFGRSAQMRHFVLLRKDATILMRHADPASKDGDKVLGKVVQKPNDPKVWGIQNLSDAPWSGVLPDGSMKEFAPGVAAPLSRGLKLNIAGAVAEILG